MEKILSKWYFSLVALPILINLFTNFIGLPDLFKQWEITLILCLFLLILILISELILLSQKLRELEFRPKESDKKIIIKLLTMLDVNTFQEEIKNQESWYGYKKEAVGKIIDFAKNVELISNKTSDKKLNRLMIDLKNAIDDFNEYSSTQLYGNGPDWYSPAKNTDFNLEKAKIAQPIMNDKANVSFEKLTLLFDYLKHKNYFE